MPITGRDVIGWTAAMLVVGLTALAGMVFASFWLSVRADHNLTDSVQAIELRRSAEGLSTALLSAEASQRGYVLTGNEIYLSPFDTAQTGALDHLERLTKNFGEDDDKRRLLASLSRVVKAKLDELKMLVALKSDRKDSDISRIMNSNSGKALMDEANVYLNGIRLEAEERISRGIVEQSENTTWLRGVSIIAALLIALVSVVIGIVVKRYAGEILEARNAIAATNETLELRVQHRTAELAKARDRAELLLAEVNHRVANSLSLVSSLIRLQVRAMTDPAARQALEQTQIRIEAIGQMHKMLFTTGEIGEVSADQYLNVVMNHLLSTVGAENGGIRLEWEIAPIKLPTKHAIHCGIIATEWVTNAYKYAYPGGQGMIRVLFTETDEGAVLSVADDGAGFSPDEPAKGTGLGSRVVQAIASQMEGRVTYERLDHGFVARLVLPRRDATA